MEDSDLSEILDLVKVIFLNTCVRSSNDVELNDLPPLCLIQQKSD